MQGDVIFAIYDPKELDNLAYKELLYALEKREGNMIYAKQMLDLNSDTEVQSVFSRLRSSFMPQ